ncbi:hypothetical protein PTHTG4_33430 [Parageobacillus thermoglucosidasius]|nr:hypothetical protein PTHTG4_33430 [Parageobacillus thermoglucosidasius]
MREKLLRCALMDEQTLGLALLMKQAGVLRRYFPEQDVSKIEYTFFSRFFPLIMLPDSFILEESDLFL